MKKSEIRVGGLYLAKVSGAVTTVLVDAIRVRSSYNDKDTTVYDVTNLRTGRRTTFRSAAKFRAEVKSPEQKEAERKKAILDKPPPFTPKQTDTGPMQEAIETSDTPNDCPCGDPNCPSPDDCDAMEESEESDPTEPVTVEATAPPSASALGAGEASTTEGNCSDPTSTPGSSGTSSVSPHSGQVSDHRATAASVQPLGVMATTEGEQRSDPTVESVVAENACVGTNGGTTTNSLASRIAASRKSSVVPEKIAGYTPTDEQRAILEAVLEVLHSDGPRVLVIEAGAGAGKTSTLKMLEEILPGRGQYTAFNKSLVEDSRPKFRRAKCNTTHSLAFAPCGRDYQHRLPGSGNARVRSNDVARMLGLQDFTVELDEYDEEGNQKTKTLKAAQLAGIVSQALKRFAQTDEPELTARHFAYVDGIDKPALDFDGEIKRGRANNDRVRKYLLPFAQRAWQDVVQTDGTFPFTHDYYVKIWQLGRPIINADYVLLDEDQDTAPVFADIIRRQVGALLILVGDENQAIYEWRGACNASKLFPDAPIRMLTQSFRFGQCVADVANSILAGLYEPTRLRMRGVAIPSRVLLGDLHLPTEDGKDTDHHVGKVCYLYRTNAGALGRILGEHALGRNGCLIGKIDDILSFVQGALDLQMGRRTSNPELAVFESWHEVQQYAKEDPDGKDLQLMVRLVDDFGAEEIIRALKNMPKEQYADFVCSTAHKSKGREWDTVVLGADFPPACDMGDPDRRLLYVAATRAKLVLDLTACTPFHDHMDKDGNRTPGIKVKFTVPNPTREELTRWRNDEMLTARSSGPGTAPTPPAAPAGIVPAPAAVRPAGTDVAAGNGIPGPAPGNGGNGGGNGGEFTWASMDGQWLVRGPANRENQTVTVTRKNGTKSQERLLNVIRKIGDLCFYAVS